MHGLHVLMDWSGGSRKRKFRTSTDWVRGWENRIDLLFRYLNPTFENVMTTDEEENVDICSENKGEQVDIGYMKKETGETEEIREMKILKVPIVRTSHLGQVARTKFI